MINKKKILAVLVLAISGITVLISCSKNSVDTPSTGTGPDSALVNIANEIIVPSYQDLATATASLDAAITTFNATPNAANLAAAQLAFKTAYISWERCSEYQFGPASDQSLLTTTINVFPTDSALIKTNINSGSYTLDGIANLKAQGFPAVDFLLFGADASTTLSRFTSDSKAIAAKAYLSAIVGSIKNKAAAVSAAWSATGGNYAAKFIAATGVSSGSSLSVLINSFVQDYDVVLKNYKIGIPYGKYGATTLPASPNIVEGFYSATSIQLMMEQVKAMEILFRGGPGYGLDDKLFAVKATKNGSPLYSVIDMQFQAVLSRLFSINEPLPSAIKNNNPAVGDAYTEISKLVVLLKVDLSSALGVKISFQDDDGD